MARLAFLLLMLNVAPSAMAAPWQRHAIDAVQHHEGTRRALWRPDPVAAAISDAGERACQCFFEHPASSMQAAVSSASRAAP